jgi:plasmid stabilization system protein ParE
VPKARAAFRATIEHIAEEDPFAATQFQARVAKSLELVQANPALGTPGNIRNRRVYAVPGTGHSFNYRVTADAVVIVRWYRQRENVPR